MLSEVLCTPSSMSWIGTFRWRLCYQQSPRRWWPHWFGAWRKDLGDWEVSEFLDVSGLFWNHQSVFGYCTWSIYHHVIHMYIYIYLCISYIYISFITYHISYTIYHISVWHSVGIPLCALVPGHPRVNPGFVGGNLSAKVTSTTVETHGLYSMPRFSDFGRSFKDMYRDEGLKWRNMRYGMPKWSNGHKSLSFLSDVRWKWILAGWRILHCLLQWRNCSCSACLQACQSRLDTDTLPPIFLPCNLVIFLWEVGHMAKQKGTVCRKLCSPKVTSCLADKDGCCVERVVLHFSL